MTSDLEPPERDTCRREISDRDADAWRRFFRLGVIAAGAVTVVIYAFVVILDPFDILPLSPAFGHIRVTANQRFGYPALARSPRFDSAVFGSSTIMLLQPTSLNARFQARFANLAMLGSTYHEQTRLMAVFIRAHPKAKRIILGVDLRWCETGEDVPKLTFRPFPEWMYEPTAWHGYREMLNMFAIQESGKKVSLLTGMKKPELTEDGYAMFVPADELYDRRRVTESLHREIPYAPPGARSGPPSTWRFVAFEALRDTLAGLPPGAEAMVLFLPHSRVIIPPPGHPGAAVWNECKHRAAAVARDRGHVMVVDFMRPSPITDDDTAFWDGEHYRVGVAERLAADLAGAAAGLSSPDYEILAAPNRSGL